MDRQLVEKIIYRPDFFFNVWEISAIFGEQDFSKLLDDVYQLPESQQQIIFSQQKKFNKLEILRNRALNEKGLHLFRMLLANCIYRENFFKTLEKINPPNPEKFLKFYEDGYLIFENFADPKHLLRLQKTCERFIAEAGEERFHGPKYYLDLSEHHGECDDFFKTDEIKNIFRLTNASLHPYLYAKRIEKVIHKSIDIQKETHCDSWHPTVKFWFFMGDVNQESGPTNYCIGSSVPNVKRFYWEFNKSLVAHESEIVGTREGSFRVSPEEIKYMRYPELSLMTVKANTLIFFNTHGFHRRGDAPDGTQRSSLMGIFRHSPFDEIVA